MDFYFDPTALQDRLEGAIAAVHAGGVLPFIASFDQGADDCQEIQRPPSFSTSGIEPRSKRRSEACRRTLLNSTCSSTTPAGRSRPRPEC
jgi:hypothetical protein